MHMTVPNRLASFSRASECVRPWQKGLPYPAVADECHSPQSVCLPATQSGAAALQALPFCARSPPLLAACMHSREMSSIVSSRLSLPAIKAPADSPMEGGTMLTSKFSQSRPSAPGHSLCQKSADYPCHTGLSCFVVVHRGQSLLGMPLHASTSSTVLQAVPSSQIRAFNASHNNMLHHMHHCMLCFPHVYVDCLSICSTGPDSVRPVRMHECHQHCADKEMQSAQTLKALLLTLAGALHQQVLPAGLLLGALP